MFNVILEVLANALRHETKIETFLKEEKILICRNDRAACCGGGKGKPLNELSKETNYEVIIQN